MVSKENMTGILNDLIRINQDRTEGYKKATDELKPSDIDLKTRFMNMATTSMQFSTELKSEVTKLGGKPVDDTTQSGKIYRVWMDIRSSASARDRKSILALCEFGEDAAQRAYDAALKSEDELSSDIKQIVEAQQAALKAEHDVIKRYRDMHEAVSK
jgi:uncharacterized protein (TIGR02284 family)